MCTHIQHPLSLDVVTQKAGWLFGTVNVQDVINGGPAALTACCSRPCGVLFTLSERERALIALRDPCNFIPDLLFFSLHARVLPLVLHSAAGTEPEQETAKRLHSERCDTISIYSHEHLGTIKNARFYEPVNLEMHAERDA